jgi:rubrerythrin
MKIEQLEELLLQSIEHEQGGVKIYEEALQCVVHPKLEEEWTRFLEQTRSHVAALEKVCAALDVDPERETPGRLVVRSVGHALVSAMKKARAAAPTEAAEIVASECVVFAETKDHLDWELLDRCAEHLPRDRKKALKEACDVIEDQEDEHLYHSKGWCRELWMSSLGLKAVLPPPEEVRDVKTAIGAARAEQSVHGR